MKRSLLLVGTFITFNLASVHAQAPPLEKRVSDLEARLNRLEKLLPANAAAAAPPQAVVKFHPGDYLAENEAANHIDLKADGTFSGKEGSEAVAGTYKVEGNTISLMVAEGKTVQGKLEEDTIIDSRGHRWVRKK